MSGDMDSQSSASQPRASLVESLKATLKLDVRFWILCIICVVCFPAVSSFNNIASAYITQRWTTAHKSFTTASLNATIGLTYMTSAVLASFTGWIIDKANRRAAFMVGAMMLTMTVHLLFATTTAPAEALLVGLGISFSFFASAFWPSIAMVVPSRLLGGAYGVVTAFQNIGLATGPVLVGLLQPPHCSGKYICVEYLFVGLAATGASFAAVASHFERKYREAQFLDLSDDEDSDTGFGSRSKQHSSARRASRASIDSLVSGGRRTSAAWASLDGVVALSTDHGSQTTDVSQGLRHFVAQVGADVGASRSQLRRDSEGWIEGAISSGARTTSSGIEMQQADESIN